MLDPQEGEVDMLDLQEGEETEAEGEVDILVHLEEEEMEVEEEDKFRGVEIVDGEIDKDEAVQLLDICKYFLIVFNQKVYLISRIKIIWYNKNQE